MSASFVNCALRRSALSTRRFAPIAPTPLKGFTDRLPEIKAMLRVCVFHLFGLACEQSSVTEQSETVKNGWIPEGYPKPWPSPECPQVHPSGTVPFGERIERQIAERKSKMMANFANASFLRDPKEGVLSALKFWDVEWD